MNDLQLAWSTLFGKQSTLTSLFDYYDGDQPLTYTAKRLEEIFKNLDAYFAENWCSVVIDSALDRINLRDIQVAGTAAAKWKDIWERLQISLESDEAHEETLVGGEGYFIAWPDSDGNPDGYVNDPRLVHLFYDTERPRVKRFAAKWWLDQDGFRRVTLYYPDRLEYYISSNVEKNGPSVDGWKRMDTREEKASNPYQEVPVFHFRVSKRASKSDLKNVIPIQNAVNKLLTDMMVAAEFGAFKQRYVISSAEVQGKLKNAPNEVWDVPAGDGIGQQTQVGQFDATELSNYFNSIDNLATAISSITRTPKHYFFSIGSNLSGEALIAMEAPLNKKAQDRVDRFAPVWKDIAIFLLKVAGESVTANDVAVIFDKPETIQPRTQAETRQMNATAGIPLETQLREEGKSPEQIAQVMRDVENQKTRDANLANAYLNQARKNFDQGGAAVTNGTNGGANA